MWGRKKKEKPEKPPKKVFSFAFLLAFPVLVFLNAVLFVSIIILARQAAPGRELLFFALAFFLTVPVTRACRGLSFLSFLHEAKHAFVVTLSGNKVKDFAWRKDPHVEFEVYQDKVQFQPFIMLAPYFFPLCSLPALCAAFFIDKKYAVPVSAALGALLALDLASAVAEFHPWQSDPKRIVGGRPLAMLFVAVANLFWIQFVLLWPLGGAKAYLNTFALLVSGGEYLFQSAVKNLSKPPARSPGKA